MLKPLCLFVICTLYPECTAQVSASSWTFTLQYAYGKEESYGNIVASNGPTTGLIDGSFGKRDAHYLCQLLGYVKATSWTAWNRASGYYKLNSETAKRMGTVLSSVSCNGTSGVFEDDCTYTTHTAENDDYYYSRTLSCVNDDEFSIITERGDRKIFGRNDDGVGSVVAKVNHYGILAGPALVCPPEGGFTKGVLDLICRQNGYVDARGSTTHRLASRDSRVDCYWAAKEGELAKVTLDIEECGANAKFTSQCDWGKVAIREGDCNIDDTLVIQCTPKEFEIRSIHVLANPDGGRTGSLDKYAADAGTVVATLRNLRNGTTLDSLVAIQSYGETATASAVCAHLGYQNGTYHAQRDMSPNERVSCGFVEERGIVSVITEYKCDGSSVLPVGCEFVDQKQDWDTQWAMAVKCFK